MDLSGATKNLFDRIQELEPENEIATKIMGYILIKGLSKQEMIRWANAPENFLRDLIYKIKLQLGILSTSPVSISWSSSIATNSPPVSEMSSNYLPFSTNGSVPYLSSLPFRSAPMQSDFASMGFVGSVGDDYGVQNQVSFVGIDDQLDHANALVRGFPQDFYNRPDTALGNLGAKFPVKTCHYFNKGFCKHGSSCRYLHGHDNFSPIFGLNDLGSEDHVFSPGSREKLEIEITELLKMRRGNPVSIASLPMLYLEKYGKSLQAEGYLTESQRHGRAGYSLTKLLARLKGIRLIDRPHGQHSVILAEDAQKYNLETCSERNDPGPIVSGSRQIYMTFPPESTFTEEDVSNYFSTFGAVEDVRMPCNPRRMYGFVTFASANTVRIVFSHGNPHFVCGSRVLVKPYREKSKLNERKYTEKSDHVLRYEPPRVLRRQLEEQEAQTMEMARRLSDLQLGHKRVTNWPYIDYGMEGLSASEDGFNYLMGLLNNSSISDDRSNHPGPDFADQDSQGINLPESPFAMPIETTVK